MRKVTIIFLVVVVAFAYTTWQFFAWFWGLFPS